MANLNAYTKYKRFRVFITIINLYNDAFFTMHFLQRKNIQTTAYRYATTHIALASATHTHLIHNAKPINRRNYGDGYIYIYVKKGGKERGKPQR